MGIYARQVIIRPKTPHFALVRDQWKDLCKPREENQPEPSVNANFRIFFRLFSVLCVAVGKADGPRTKTICVTCTFKKWLRIPCRGTSHIIFCCGKLRDPGCTISRYVVIWRLLLSHIIRRFAWSHYTTTFLKVGQAFKTLAIVWRFQFKKSYKNYSNQA